MLYSQETAYAIRIIDALKDGEQHKARDICIEQGIPSVWIYKIAKKLEKAGFISIKLGCAGGYRLLKSLDDFTFKDLVLAVEPDICIRPCLNAPCPLHRDKGTCPIYFEIIRLQSGIMRLLDESTMRNVLIKNDLQ